MKIVPRFLCTGGPIPTHGKVVACYFPSWVTSESESELYSIDSTRGDLCTHLIYYAAGLNASTASVVTRTPKIDLPDNGGKSLNIPSPPKKNIILLTLLIFDYIYSYY